MRVRYLHHNLESVGSSVSGSSASSVVLLAHSRAQELADEVDVPDLGGAWRVFERATQTQSPVHLCLRPDDVVGLYAPWLECVADVKLLLCRLFSTSPSGSLTFPQFVGFAQAEAARRKWGDRVWATLGEGMDVGEPLLAEEAVLGEREGVGGVLPEYTPITPWTVAIASAVSKGSNGLEDVVEYLLVRPESVLLLWAADEDERAVEAAVKDVGVEFVGVEGGGIRGLVEEVLRGMASLIARVPSVAIVDREDREDREGRRGSGGGNETLERFSVSARPMPGPAPPKRGVGGARWGEDGYRDGVGNGEGVWEGEQEDSLENLSGSLLDALLSSDDDVEPRDVVDVGVGRRGGEDGGGGRRRGVGRRRKPKKKPMWRI